MVSEEFKQNVESGNVVRIRSALVDYLITDTTFRQFDEALSFAQRQIDVIKPDDGEVDYDLVQEHWDEIYLSKQKVALMDNFSQKRIDHIKQVIKTVLADKVQGVQNSDDVKELSETQGNNQSANVGINANTKEPKTGKIIKEKNGSVKRTEEKVHPVDIAAWMIGGGLAMAAAGGLTAGIGAVATKLAVVHVGAAMAGVGGVTAVSGGVMKTVKKYNER